MNKWNACCKEMPLKKGSGSPVVNRVRSLSGTICKVRKGLGLYPDTDIDCTLGWLLGAPQYREYIYFKPPFRHYFCKILFWRSLELTRYEP